MRAQYFTLINLNLKLQFCASQFLPPSNSPWLRQLLPAANVKGGPEMEMRLSGLFIEAEKRVSIK